MLSWQQADMRNRAGSYGRPPPEASLLSWPTSCCCWFLFNNLRKIHCSTQSSHNPHIIFNIQNLLRRSHPSPSFTSSPSQPSQAILPIIETPSWPIHRPKTHRIPFALQLLSSELKCPFQIPDPSIHHTCCCCCLRQPNQSPEHKRFPEWVDESADDDDASPSAASLFARSPFPSRLWWRNHSSAY